MLKIENLKLTNFWFSVEEFKIVLKKCGQNNLVNTINRFLSREEEIDELAWNKLIELILLTYVDVSYVSEIFDYSDAEKQKLFGAIKNKETRNILVGEIFKQNQNTVAKNGIVFGDLFDPNFVGEVPVEKPNKKTESAEIENIWQEWYSEYYDDTFDVDWDSIDVEPISLNTKKFIECLDKINEIEESIEKNNDIYSSEYVHITKHKIKELNKSLNSLNKKRIIYGKKLTRVQTELYILPDLCQSFIDFNDHDYKIDPRIPYKK